LNNPDCQLFTEVVELVVDGAHLDDLVIAANSNGAAIVPALKQLNSVGRSFKQFTELSAPVKRCVETGDFCGDELSATFYSRINDAKYATLIAGSPWEEKAVDSDRTLLKQLMVLTRGTLLLDFHLKELLQSGQTCNSLGALLQLVEKRAHTSEHKVSDEDRQALFKYLSEESHLFAEVKTLTIDSSHFDELVIRGKGLQAVLAHLTKFDKVDRRFPSFEALLPAVEEARTTGLYADAKDRARVRAYLDSKEHKLFVAEDDSKTFDFTEHELEEMLAVTHGQVFCVDLLRQLDIDRQHAQQPPLKSKAELLAAVTQFFHQRSSKHANVQERVVAYMTTAALFG
jgi:hypothetical protein